MYYSTVGILAFLVLIIENRDILFFHNHAFDKPSWKAYKHFLFAVLAYYTTDILWGILDYFKLETPLFIDTSVYFIAMAAGIWLWTKYCVSYLEEKNIFERILVYAGRIFAALVAVLVIVNIFVPTLFTINEACEYKALSTRYILLGVQIIMLLLISAYALYVIVRRRSEKQKRYRTLAWFGLIMSVFLFAQLWFPLLPLYSIAYMFGTCLLRAVLIADEKEEFRQGMEEATEIAELKQSITSLLDNMPVMSFSKDVETGAYLACNQSFAEYANKPSPQGVVGLTDYEIFDAQTAAHFVEDDRKALSMDTPYVLYEDVADAAGNPRQFQTTKLKFYDESGRLCLLGMSLDVTEMESVKKENEQTKAAYQEILSSNIVYENIVSVLSEDYFDLYYVDLETDAFIEYGSKTEAGYRTTENRGTDFFTAVVRDAQELIYEDDRAGLIDVLDKEHLKKEIEENGVMRHYYRLLIGGEPTYVSIKALRIIGDDRHVIIGVTNVDAQMKDRMAAESAAEERKAYMRLNALNRNLLVLYIVNPETEEFEEFNTSEDFEKFGIEKKGDAFFETTYKNSLSAVYPEDLERFRSVFTKENILRTIEQDGLFILNYRLVYNSKMIYVRLKATEVEEDGKTSLIIGVDNVDAQVRSEMRYAKELSAAKKLANKDALTGTKNTHAFTQAEADLTARIEAGEAVEFCIVVCDINGLKTVNDTMGHKTGDTFIRKASEAICDIFKHSPVFRIGGDEFAVICQGHDYEQIDALLEQMKQVNAAHQKEGDVQIAFGMARYENDALVSDVFERADKRMYANKAGHMD